MDLNEELKVGDIVVFTEILYTRFLSRDYQIINNKYGFQFIIAAKAYCSCCFFIKPAEDIILDKHETAFNDTFHNIYLKKI